MPGSTPPGGPGGSMFHGKDTMWSFKNVAIRAGTSVLFFSGMNKIRQEDVGRRWCVIHIYLFIFICA